MTSNPGSISSYDDFADDADGQQKYWQAELEAADQDSRVWRNEGDDVIRNFRDERKGQRQQDRNTYLRRLNLFTANTKIKRALMFAQLPTVEVKRQFDDPNDDVARVAAELIERLLNCDIQAPGADFDSTLLQSLDDRLLPGLGVARCRYDADFQVRQVEAIADSDGNVLAEGYEEKVKTREDAPCDYVHWRDFRWSPVRVWGEVRWIGFLARMSKDHCEKRFGAEKCKNLMYQTQRRAENADAQDVTRSDPWQRAEIWEIWDKERKRVVWFSKGAGKLLDEKPDPLGLPGFFPCPMPMRANITTSTVTPRSDYKLAEDQYAEVNRLTARIAALTRAVKAVGVYDGSMDEIKRMLSEGMDNDLIPVSNWAMFGEKGGLSGVIDWMPIDMIVAALDKLHEQRASAMELIWQVEGMNDIMRGANAQGQARTLGEQRMRTMFGSVLIQTMQDDFARFAAELQTIKAHIAVKFFDDATILKRSNARFLSEPDQQLIPQALALLRSSLSQWRITIEPESLALADMFAKREERNAFLGAVTSFVTAAGPLAEQIPGSLPMLLEMLKWGVQGYKGADTIEGTLDAAIEATKQPQEPQPDPAAALEQIKAQAEQAMSAQEHEQKMVEMQAQAQLDMMERAAQLQAKLTELRMQSEAELLKVQAEAGADIESARAKLRSEMDQIMVQSQVEEAKARAEHNRSLKREAAHTELNLVEADEKAAIDIESRRAVGNE